MQKQVIVVVVSVESQKGSGNSSLEPGASHSMRVGMDKLMKLTGISAVFLLIKFCIKWLFNFFLNLIDS